MNYQKVEEKFREKNDEELRIIIKRIQVSKRLLRKIMDEAYSKYWNIKDMKLTMEEIEWDAKKIRGERKGMGCPALVKEEQKDGCGYTSHVFNCKARRCAFPYRHSLKEMYQDFCYSCRLTHIKAKTKAVMNGVFNK